MTRRPILAFLKRTHLRYYKRSTDPDAPPLSHATIYRKAGADYVILDTGDIVSFQFIAIQDELIGAAVPSSALILPVGVPSSISGGAFLRIYPAPIQRRVCLLEPNFGSFIFRNIGGNLSGLDSGHVPGSVDLINGLAYHGLSSQAGVQQEWSSQTTSTTNTVRASYSPLFFARFRLDANYSAVGQSGYMWLMLSDYINSVSSVADITTDSFSPTNLTAFGFRIGKAGAPTYYKVRVFMCNNSTTPTFSATDFDVITPGAANDLELTADYDYPNSRVVFTVNGAQAIMTSPLLTSTTDLKFTMLSKASVFPASNVIYYWNRIMIESD